MSITNIFTIQFSYPIATNVITGYHTPGILPIITDIAALSTIYFENKIIICLILLMCDLKVNEKSLFNSFQINS